MLEITNLHVEIEDKKILNGLNLTVNDGEVAAIMGPNGSGKSTLSYVIAGRTITRSLDGEILLNGENLLEMEPDERAAAGVFLAFQYPLEIPGVATMTFLKAALNAQRKARGEAELTDARLHEARERGAPNELAHRRRTCCSARAQCRLLRRREEAHGDPADGAAGAGFCILDETDSGLDIDALRSSPTASTRCARPSARSWSSPTTSACSNYIVPDTVHVMAQRPHRALRRQGAGAGARSQWLSPITARRRPE